MRSQRSKVWIIGYLILVTGALSMSGYWVVKVDPFFHYHKPDTDRYYYELDNQRSQNDGIIKYFDYDAVITGSSMTQNFNTSEMDTIFGTNSVKVSYAGGSYKEINDNLFKAFENNPGLKTVIRGLDMGMFVEDKDAMRSELGEYPTYLYDDIWYNDVRYIFNRDVVFKRVLPMLMANKLEGFKPGITSFDTYSNWMGAFTFGKDTVCPDGIENPNNAEVVHLTEEEKTNVIENVRQNITSAAEAYPDVTFYYFIPPYSIAWWRDLVDNGLVYKQIEAERLVIEEVLKYANINLYSFNNLTDIITDLNNYKDTIHYGSWINSLVLQYMKDEEGLLTNSNYREYLNSELSFYLSFDYELLNEQEDYENDYYAGMLLGDKTYGDGTLDLLNAYKGNMEIRHAEILEDKDTGEVLLQCKGSLQRNWQSKVSVPEYIAKSDYIGAKITIDDIGTYRYLSFEGIKNQDHGQPSVYIYDQNNVVLKEFAIYYQYLDEQWNQYVIEIPQVSGQITIILNGGYTDGSGSADSMYTFKNIILN